MNTPQNPQLHKHSVVRRFYLSIRDEIKSIGAFKARKAVETATAIGKYKTSNLALYGEPYRETMEFARLELAEKFSVFKYEFYKALFRL